MASIDFGQILSALQGGAKGFRGVQEKKLAEELKRDLLNEKFAREEELLRLREEENIRSENRANARNDSVRQEDFLIKGLLSAAEAGVPGLKNIEGFSKLPAGVDAAALATNRSQLRDRRISDKKEVLQQIESDIGKLVSEGKASPELLTQIQSTKKVKDAKALLASAQAQAGTQSKEDRDLDRQRLQELIGRETTSPFATESMAFMSALSQRRAILESSLETLPDFSNMNPADLARMSAVMGADPEELQQKKAKYNEIISELDFLRKYSEVAISSIMPGNVRLSYQAERAKAAGISIVEFYNSTLQFGAGGSPQSEREAKKIIEDAYGERIPEEEVPEF